jgi:hypothetical protein
VIEPALAASLFSTPILVIDLPDMAALNAALADQLVAEEQTTPSWQRANVGAWHSAPDLSRRPQACYQTLMRTVVDAVGSTVAALAQDAGIAQLPAFRYAVTGWAMVMRHGDAHWSAAYYVDAGDEAPAPSGRLAFVDPRRSGRPIPGITLFPSMFDLAPRTGALVIFPGWLQHYVHAYRGARPRICVSCNLTMELVAPPPAGP